MTRSAEKFEKLIVGYLEDTATEAELQEFFELLKQDGKARDSFSSHAALHGVLTWMHHQRVDTFSRDDSTHDKTDSIITSDALVTKKRINAWWIPFFVLAASLAVLVTTFWIVKAKSPSLVAESSVLESAVQAAKPSPFAEDAVARIVRKVDCDWEGDRWSVVSSSYLFPGQSLKMARGLMELQFSSGARVTLEAPVAFTVKSSMRGILAHGKLTAKIPKSAHGFTISTPNGDAIDLGTSFGLFVGEDGVTETHVFEGEVVVRSQLSKGKTDDLHLTDDMALRVSRDLRSQDSIPAVPDRFTRLEFKDEENSFTPSVDRKLALWLSADRRYQIDESGRISAWGDLCTQSNKKAENAWQVDQAKRPLRVESAIGNHAAIRFDRGKAMVTEPLKLGTAQTIAIVFRINDELVDKWGVNENGRQLLNLNGPPHLVLRINDRKQLVSGNYTGFLTNDEGKRKYVSVGKMKSERNLDSGPVVAVTAYDPSKDSSRLFINGEQAAEAKAPKLEPTESPRYIGSHMFLLNTNFLGDISEIMIYDTGLKNQEVLKLSKSLLEKYDIPFQASNL